MSFEKYKRPRDKTHKIADDNTSEGSHKDLQDKEADKENAKSGGGRHEPLGGVPFTSSDSVSPLANSWDKNIGTEIFSKTNFENLPPSPKENPLNARQKLFCEIYVKNGYNGKEAVLKSGFKCSENNAVSTAKKLLSLEKVKKYIAVLQEPIFEELGIDEEWVQRKLKNFSEAVITDFFELVFDEDGKPSDLRLKDLTLLPRETVAAIDSIKKTTRGFEIKLVDRRACVVDLGKAIGLFKDGAGGEVNVYNQQNQGGSVFVLPEFQVDQVSKSPEEKK
jgi:hypothetical protein